MTYKKQGEVIVINARYDFIDAAKGIGILCVIAGHLIALTTFPSCVLFSFHMPLFFFLSGIFARPKSPQTFPAFLKHLCKRFLPVYVAFMGIGMLFTMIVPGADTMTAKSILSDLYQGIPGGVHVGQFWFLTSLIEIKIAFFFADKYVFSKNKRFLTVALLLAVLALVLTQSYYLPYFPYGRLPLKLDSSMMGFLFFVCGHFTKTIVLRLPEYKKSCTVLVFVPCLLVTLFVSPVNGWVNIASLKYYNWCLYFLFAFTGIVAVLLLGMYIVKCKLLLFLGRNTMLIFAMHSMVIYLYDSFLYVFARYTHTTPIQNGVQSMPAAAVGTVLVTAVCAITVLLYQKIRGRLSCVESEKNC